MSEEKCVRCGDIGEDRRTLWMACFYAMEELGIPFVQVDVKEYPKSFYTLRVCKACRADWMASIGDWFNSKPKNEAHGTGIYVRKLGATFEISEEEWRRNNPGRDPVRYRGEQ